MAANESIGAVSVVIGGDYSKLVTDFAQAQGVAQKAGAAVASAFTGGAASAPQIVNQFGQAVSSAGSASASAAPQVAALSSQTASLANNATQAANALVRQASAAHAGVTEIQATSGALRVLEGSGGIRAAERFLTLIPGLGQVLVSAFPVVGAIALGTALIHMGEAAYKAGQNFLFMKDATEAANKIAVQFAGQFVAAAEAMDKIEADLLDRVGKYVEASQVRIRSLASTPIHLADLLNDKDIKSAIDGFTNQPAWNNLKNLFTDVIPADIPERIASITEALKPIETEMANIKRSGFDPTGMSQHWAAQDKVEVDLYASAVALLNQKLAEFKAQGGLVTTHAGDRQTSDAAKGAEEQIHAAEEANKRQEELNKQHIEAVADANRQIAQIQIDGIRSDAGRRDAAAQADIAKAVELRDRLTLEAISTRDVAIGNAQALRGQEATTAKTPLEQQKVGINFDTRVDAANTDFQKTTGGLDRAVDDAKAKLVEVRETFAREVGGGIGKVLDEIDNGLDKMLARMQVDAEKTGQALTKVFEIQDKSKGEQADLSIQAQKLLLERQYGLEVDHNSLRQIDFQKQIAALDLQARQAKITGLQNSLGEVSDDPGNAEAVVKRAELEAQIAQLKAQSNNEGIAAQTKILEMIQKQTFEVQIQEDVRKAAGAIPGAIGGAVSQGIFQGGKGSSIGQVITQALKGVGQQLLGGIFTAVIHQLIASLLATTIAQHLMAAIFGTSTSVQAANTAAVTAAAGVTAANTAAVIANTAAQATSAGAGAAGAGVQAASTAAKTASAAASTVASAATGFIGQFGGLIGGLGGGLISGIFSLIGDNKIVQAVNATTAAVNALHGTVAIGSTATGTTATTATPAQPSIVSTASQGGLVGFFSSILGLGGSKPMDVNIVSISPMSPLKGIFNLFGFADGGSPPVGVPSIVGERGPEIFVPKASGTIIPNHMIKGYAEGAGLDQLPSASGGRSSAMHTLAFSGDMHFHAHGVSPTEHAQMMVREVPRVLKARGAQWSPFSS
jgi:hypothetical protein